MKRRLSILFILLIFLIAGGSGCMANDKAGFTFGLPPLDTVDFAQAALKEKYGEEFRYLGAWGSALDDDKKFLVSCDSLPGQRILVRVSNFRDKNKRSVSDNVLTCRYAQETEDFLKNCAEETIGSARVFYEPSMQALNSSLPTDLPFERFLSESGVFLGATIEVKGSEFLTEEQARCLIQRIADSGVRCNLDIVALPDQVFGTLSRDEVRRCVKSCQYVHFAAVSCENGVIEVNFRGGYA